MELNIDTGVEEFRVNGRGVLRFNPADPNLYHRFFAAGAELDGYDAALTKALAALDGDEQQRAAAGLAQLNEYDGKIKKLLTGIFGEENDFDAILGGVNLAGVGANGKRVVQNLLEALTPILREGAERRLTAMLQSCKELEQICPQFRTEEALELARDSGTLFKAQVMRVLWQYGLADGMYNTVYKSLFGLKPVRGRILHTPRYEPVDTVLEVIKASRAVVVLAHPSVYHSMELARELIAAGRLDGVEINHPRNTPEDKAELARLAKENGLIVTGGTDYHGINTVTPRPVGAFSTSDEMIARIGDIAKARKATWKKAK